MSSSNDPNNFPFPPPPSFPHSPSAQSGHPIFNQEAHTQTDLDIRNTIVGCHCYVYMPPGEHDPFEHEETRGDAMREIEKQKKLEQEAEEQAEKERRKRVAMSREEKVEEKMMGAGGEGLVQLRGTLMKQSPRNAMFTCGGKIPIVMYPNVEESGKLTPRTAGEVQDQKILTGPVRVRWGQEGQGRLVSLPATSPSDKAALQDLITACDPATFGRGGKDVFDESYRRAGAMKTEDFMSDFCPYRSGIIDQVTQLLLPPVVGELGENGKSKNVSLSRGLRAELYKLNVYSGPSGLFKAHVDTPRSETQIGSLVVCLSVPFEGGGLAVRHQDQEIVHDWATGPHPFLTGPSIQWAAFYSDCQHEVLPVTSGHRLTLTYNLFLSSGTGLLNGRLPSMLPDGLPLYNKLKSLLNTQAFMPQGGYIGIHLTHSYPHTHKKLLHLVPKMLKGIDMAIYSSFTHAKLACVLVPLRRQNLLPLRTLDHLDELHLQQHRDIKLSKLSLFEACGVDYGCDEDERATPKIMEDIPEDIDFESDFDISDEDVNHDDYDYDLEWVHRGAEKTWDVAKMMRDRNRVMWINEEVGGREELGRVYMAYGNQAELAVRYTSAAIIVKVPSWEERAASWGSRRRDGGACVSKDGMIIDDE